MKKCFFILILICLSLSVSAQKFVKVRDVKDMVFVRGTQLWSLTGSFLDNHAYLGDNLTAKVPAIRLRGEICVFEFPFGGSIGAGWSLGYGQIQENRQVSVSVGWDNEKKQDIWGTEVKQYMWTQLPAGASLSFHYSLFDHCDVYAKGFFCVDFGGWGNLKQELDNKRPKSIRNDYGIVAGAEYFITDRIGLCVEGGLQSQWLSAGLVISFGRSAESDLFYRTPRDI